MQKQIDLISDFNVVPLARHLENCLSGNSVAVNTMPYGQVFQSLAGSDISESALAAIWTLPESVIPSFARVLGFEDIPLSDCLAEVDAFADALLNFATSRQHVFVASWALAPEYRGYGMLDWCPGLGAAYIISRMNQLLAERVAETRNIHLLDSARWLYAAAWASAPKMWYAAKMPFAYQVFAQAATDLAAAIRAVSGQSRRLIIVDLDNTLWGGVVGETGWQGLRLGAPDRLGEAFIDFQRGLKALSNRGVQLAIASKNDEAVALEAIDCHPEMVLRRTDFAGWRINWGDKAQNVLSLVEEINLGLSSVVFIDDNPVERERIRAALPDVLVPEWPADPQIYLKALRSLDCFDTPGFTKEDRERTQMYVTERQRKLARTDDMSLDAWLAHLAPCMHVTGIDDSNIARVAQLLNKTNQLNLSTRRLSEREILDWLSQPNHWAIACRVSDRFGDLGLVGIASLEIRGSEGFVVDLLLSCRAMGRNVEDAMLHVCATELSRRGVSRMVVRYVATKRNRPTLEVLQRSSLDQLTENVFVFDCLRKYPKPQAMSIVAMQQLNQEA